MLAPLVMDYAEADDAIVEMLRQQAAGGGFLQRVPRFDGEIHSVAGLARLGSALFEVPAREL